MAWMVWWWRGGVVAWWRGGVVVARDVMDVGDAMDAEALAISGGAGGAMGAGVWAISGGAGDG